VTCNGLHHAKNCQCGWGGYTGNRNRNPIYPCISLREVDGFTWNLNRNPTYESFINPNARCNVCHAPVYFYQSPYGGRVFFDDLGPPWPKHPCGDSARTRQALMRSAVLAPKNAITTNKRMPLPPEAWRPLLIDQVVSCGDTDTINILTKDPEVTKFVSIPKGWIGDTPVFWRRCPRDSNMIDISCFRISSEGTFETRNMTAQGREDGVWIVCDVNNESTDRY